MTDAYSSTSGAYTASTGGDAWAAEAARQGKVGTQRLLDVEALSPPAHVREALRLPGGATVIRRRRLVLADDQPIEIAASYYPADIAAGTPLAEAKKIKGGAVRVLLELGYPLEESVELVSAERPTAEDVGLLAVEPTTPLLVIRRTSGRVGGRPAEFAENRMVADRSGPLMYRLRSGSPA